MSNTTCPAREALREIATGRTSNGEKVDFLSDIASAALSQPCLLAELLRELVEALDEKNYLWDGQQNTLKEACEIQARGNRRFREALAKESQKSKFLSMLAADAAGEDY